MKYTTIFLLIISTLSLNALTDKSYVYNGLKDIKFTKHNNGLIEEPPVIVKPFIENVCKIEVTGLDAYYGNTYYGRVSFTLDNGSKFDFGSLLLNQKLFADFENATINISSSASHHTNNNANILISQAKLWYSQTTLNQSFTINFKEPQNILRFQGQDRVYSGDNYGSKNYNISVFNCQNSLLGQTDIVGSLSPANGVIFDVDFKALFE